MKQNPTSIFQAVLAAAMTIFAVSVSTAGEPPDGDDGFVTLFNGNVKPKNHTGDFWAYGIHMP